MASFARVNPRTHAREPQSGPAPQDRRSTPKGLSLLASHGALYLLTLVGALAPLPLSVNLAFSIANGVLIALLFILGHDAAHGSLVRKRHLNRWLARLAFIPCAHSVSLWRTIHNHGHHARTNLKGSGHTRSFASCFLTCRFASRRFVPLGARLRYRLR